MEKFEALQRGYVTGNDGRDLLGLWAALVGDVDVQ